MHTFIFLITFILLILSLVISGSINYHIGALNQSNPFGTDNSLSKERLSQTIFSVNKTFPMDSQLDVKLDKKISVTFNGILNSNSVKNWDDLHNLIVTKGNIQSNLSNVSSIDRGNIVQGKYSLTNNNQTLVFKPHSTLTPNTVHSVILFGKDHCPVLSKVSSNETVPPPVFTVPVLSNSNSNITDENISSNKKGDICNLVDTAGKHLDRNYVWSFSTSLSPPIISQPKSNSSSNKKTMTFSGTDPNHSDLVQLFRLDGGGPDEKQKLVGSAVPAEDGDWSVKLHLGKLGDGIYRFVAKAFENIHNKSSDGSDKLTLGIDTQPPIVEVPSDIVVQNSEREDSTITFQSNATDNLDGTVKTICSPLNSGDIFPVGITKVICKATDKANNEGSASFNVNITAMNELALSCSPNKVAIVKGTERSINCIVENKTFSPLELALSCSHLDEVGIECYINGKLKSATMSLKEKSSDNFHVLISSKSSQISPGLYPFTISANCKDNSC
ncbi:MAG TPA: HYR domain-containing protein [Nitrososphaeraceae archaeon]